MARTNVATGGEKRSTSGGILFMYHCAQDVGYAIGRLEGIFNDAARAAGFDEDRIYRSYRRLTRPSERVIQCLYDKVSNPAELRNFLRKHDIRLVVAFDLYFPADVIPVLKSVNGLVLVSYWGAGMSPINSGSKLLFKRLESRIRRNVPDCFVFESEAMRRTATHGRGVPLSRTEVIRLGVDTAEFSPDPDSRYVHQVFDVPEHRRVVFYSGHMEERKGVRVIVNAAIELVDARGRDDVHFVICGNRREQARPYLEMLTGMRAEANVTFGGYREDMPPLMASSYLGVIASTGWDSFTFSSIEMMASGLPLLVSDLEGLAETMEPGVSGCTFPPGDHRALANLIETFLDDVPRAQAFGAASRRRAVEGFARRAQVKNLAALFSRFAHSL